MNSILVLSSIIAFAIIAFVIYLIWDIREQLKKIAKSLKNNCSADETTNQYWNCPKCLVPNSNNVFTCSKCGYSLK